MRLVINLTCSRLDSLQVSKCAEEEKFPSNTTELKFWKIKLNSHYKVGWILASIQVSASESVIS